MEHHPVINRPYLCITISTDRPTLHRPEKTFLGYSGIDRSKVSTPKGKRSPFNRGTLAPCKNHNQIESKTPWLDVRGQTPHLLSWEVTPLFLKPKVETLAVKMRTSMTLSLNPTFHYCKDTTFSGIPTHWSVNLLLILALSFVVSCFWYIFVAFKIQISRRNPKRNNRPILQPFNCFCGHNILARPFLHIVIVCRCIP